MITIKIPIYNADLHFVDVKDSKQLFKDVKNEDKDGTSIACLIWNHEKFPANWWICIDLVNLDNGMLIHELFHATHRILEYFDIEFTSENHEPFAYLIEYLFNQFFKSE